MKTSFYLIIVGTLLAFFLLLPSVILPSCPKGLTNDPFPGRCGLWEDQNQDQICDFSQTASFITPEKRFNFSFGWQTGIFLILLAIAIILMVKTQKLIYRYLLLTASLIFGFFTFKLLCPISFLQFLFISKDKAVLSFFPFLIFFSTLITTLIFGRVFCGWICPIGAFQELIYRLPGWLKLKIPRFTKKIPSIFRYLPLLVLATIGFWVIRSGKTAFCQLDPFAYLFGLSVDLVLLGVLIMIIIASLFIFRPFCLFACPLAPIFSALSSVSFWQIRRDKKKCNQCKICIQKCQVGAIDENLKIDEKICFSCQDCLFVCSKKAFSYKG